MHAFDIERKAVGESKKVRNRAIRANVCKLTLAEFDKLTAVAP